MSPNEKPNKRNDETDKNKFGQLRNRVINYPTALRI